MKYPITPKITAIIKLGVHIIFIFSSAPVYVVKRLDMKFVAVRNRTLFDLVLMKDSEVVENISFAFNKLTSPLTSFAFIVASTGNGTTESNKMETEVHAHTR